MDRESTKALLDAPEAAGYLGVNVTTVYDYVHQGLLAFVKLPKRSDDRKRTDAIGAPRRKYQFRRSDLDHFIAGRVVPMGDNSATISATNQVAKTRGKVIERDWWKRESG
ncbi:MAG: helix-turn-helix domain-containing protein [Terrimicrobiaceae bacterium]|nr:helix-turn-helix domain-containing protein [Terrimicrobiaceae bacterium]